MIGIRPLRFPCEEIQEILLLAMYCGIPSANEAHRVAVDVLGEAQRP